MYTKLIREAKYFTGIRKPIKSREEIFPRVKKIREALNIEDNIPFVHLLRFDTPVDGYDSEVGFFLNSEVNQNEIKTSMLRKHYYIVKTHCGPLSKIRETTIDIYKQLNKSGLAAELEIMETYKKIDFNNPESDENEIEIAVSYLAWKEVYYENLIKNLDKKTAEEIWSGGEELTPFTDVNTRAKWVGESLLRLKKYTNNQEQYNILSRVCLKRPIEDTNYYKLYYEETKSLEKTLQKHNEDLEKLRGESGGYVEKPFVNDKVLHLSKVPYSPKAYGNASTETERRKAFCFCTLIREVDNPQIDPIFCFRATGWARQFWEGITGLEFKNCRIIKSILKGDEICSWEYDLE